MKLSKWAKKQGIHYQTAWKWFREGKIKGAYKSETGSFFVTDSSEIDKNDKVCVYCRVSNFSRRNELEYQVKRCNDYCSAAGIVVNKTYKEVASGMNENRKEFWKMLDSSPTKIIVENKDRLSRFGFSYIKRLSEKNGCQVIVINESVENKEDLVKDLVSVIYSFCARLYGMRRAKNKADKVRAAIKD